MANWKTHRISDIVNEIDEEKYVLPVIQRSLVWREEKMELLFDTLLKGDSFGGIMVIQEEKESEPLFNYRPFTKDGNFIPSRQVNKLTQQQFFVIDGQQRLQTFYIGLKGSINGKNLFFDLYSEFNSFYEFKFEKDENNLPEQNNDDEDRAIKDCFWFPVKELLRRLKETNDDDQVAESIIANKKITDEDKKKHISRNIRVFYRNIIAAEALGISNVVINKSLPELDNRQRIVELFRRLNDGGTRLSPFDLVASILKGFSWEMEGFLKEVLENNEDIDLTQDNLIKLIFLLQDNHRKEMVSIEASDATFAIDKADRIKATIKALKDFLNYSKLYDYYKEGNKSFVPIFFIAYHLFHLNISDSDLKKYFDNYDTGNSDYPLMHKWLFNSLANGVFRSRGAGWIPYKTGIRKLLNEIKNHKGKTFPCQELFQVYYQHPIRFTEKYTIDNLDNLDRTFLFYLMYGCTRTNRTNDIDHIMPKNILESKGFEWEMINSIKNFQLLDYGTNRGEKNGKPFKQWVDNPSYVQDKKRYTEIHLIPDDENIWDEDNFEDFLKERGNLILNKIIGYL